MLQGTTARVANKVQGQFDDADAVLASASVSPSSPVHPFHDSTQQKSMLIPEPEPYQDNDVLLGRGGGTNRHTGNQYFRTLVMLAQPTYVTSPRSQKREIAETIVKHVQRRGGQFLKFEEDMGRWMKVNDMKATLKASQALREGSAKEMRQCFMERQRKRMRFMDEQGQGGDMVGVYVYEHSHGHGYVHEYSHGHGMAGKNGFRPPVPIMSGLLHSGGP